MAITTSTLIEDSFKTIVKSNGLGGEEDQVLINSAELENASSAPKISIANLYYEVLGTGNVTVFFKNDEEKKVTLSGRGNYGLKPNESKVKDPVGDIMLSSDSNVSKFNLIIESHKESGFN